MFENLQNRLQGTLRQMRGQHRISEKNVKDALREVRVALLEADVNYQAVRDFLGKVQERAVGAEVLEGVNPGQQFVKIVHEELIDMIGGGTTPPDLPHSGRRVIMLVGLQGSGKTTTCNKLANLLKKQGHKPMMVAADVYRPAAIKQLEVLGEQHGIPVFSMGANANPVDIARAGVRGAAKQDADTVILDTAGRLHVDEKMMDELVQVRHAVRPHWTLLVVDAMTGQDAVNQAKQFNSAVGIDGVVLTKLDGDARGGAALSIRSVTGKPILYAATGEKVADFERFHPDRMASRILGMGDVLTLVEKAQEVIDQKDAQDMQEKLLKQTFTLDDFLGMIRQTKKMGPIGKVMEMIPGMADLRGMRPDAGEDEERELKMTEAIICSMTMDERKNPKVIGGSRRKRIARGSGTKVQDVNRLLKQFSEVKKMMKLMVGGGAMPGMGGAMPAGMGDMSALSGGGGTKALKAMGAKGGGGGKGGKKKKLSKEEKKLLKMLRGKGGMGGGGGFPF